MDTDIRGHNIITLVSVSIKKRIFKYPFILFVGIH